jgi:N-methylhydantoinase A
MMVRSERLRIAVDIGGTFTDCVVIGDAGTRINTKALTTTDDPARGVIDAVQLVADQLGTSLEEVVSSTSSFVHGTTVGTNALVTRRGAETGLLMTSGHEETITIGRVRQKVAGLSEREKIHITHLSKADPPLVKPKNIRPIVERIDYAGNVVVPLDVPAAERSIDELVGEGIEAVAICLLWSFVESRHEDELREVVTKRHPQLYVAISSEVAPVLGEYERSVSTVLNAYLGPRVSGYLMRLERLLQDLGLRSALLVMQANGGVTSVEGVRDRPLVTVDSGPAGGVLGARYHAEITGRNNIICADVGGTTFDVGLVHNSRVEMDRVPIIDRYEYAMPKVAVKSIGAGGGSIVWVDGAGSLRVGPQSAGSNPGPACYGRGGNQPTVTDAHLLLGFLDPTFPLGGHVNLDLAAAEAAMATLTGPLGITVPEIAGAVAAISNSQMADLVRKVTVERGLDPREFAVAAFGGAGPVFGAFLAQQIGAEVVYVAANSGVFSAGGMMTTDLLLEEQRGTVMRSPLDEGDIQRLNAIFADLEKRLLSRFAAAGFDAEQVVLSRFMDMRLAAQVHELEAAVPGKDALTQESMQFVEEIFLSTYERTYGSGSAYTQAGIEIAKLRTTGVIALEKPPLAVVKLREPGAGTAAKEASSRRPVLFDVRDGYVDTAIYTGEEIVAGDQLEGPAIIQRAIDTIVIPPGAHATVDDQGSVLITRNQRN